MQTFEAPEGYAYIQDISTIAATSLVINMLRRVEAKISTMSIPSESLSGKRDDLNRLTDNLSKQVKAAYELSHSRVGTSSDVISTSITVACNGRLSLKVFVAHVTEV